MKKKINIFGSCCTRELFNYQEKYEVGCYVMQQSLFTLFAKPWTMSYEQAKGTDDSKFKKRMMYYEFNKLGLKKVLEEPADYLIIDFADCRYDIYEFDSPQGVKIIYTHESRATFENIKDDKEFKNIDKHYLNVVENFDDKQLTEILKKFCEQILKVYDKDHIILNKIQMYDKYFEDGVEKRLENNFHLSRKDFIAKIENIFLKVIPDCRVLETEESPVLNINHKFGGPHPMHYEDIYYEYKMKLLDNLISSQNNLKAIKQEYLEKLNKNIDSIKAKTHELEKVCNSTARVD